VRDLTVVEVRYRQAGSVGATRTAASRISVPRAATKEPASW
jgi:hypothetical protein